MVVTTLDASWGFVFRPSHAREVSSQLSRDGDQRPHHDRRAESAGNVGVAPALRSPQGLPEPCVPPKACPCPSGEVRSALGHTGGAVKRPAGSGVARMGRTLHVNPHGSAPRPCQFTELTGTFLVQPSTSSARKARRLRRWRMANGRRGLARARHLLGPRARPARPEAARRVTGPGTPKPSAGGPAHAPRVRARPDLLPAHGDGLPQHQPGHALQQRRRGQRAGVGPEVQAAGEEAARVEVREVGALTLAEANAGDQRRRRTGRGAPGLPRRAPRFTSGPPSPDRKAKGLHGRRLTWIHGREREPDAPR